MEFISGLLVLFGFGWLIWKLIKKFFRFLGGLPDVQLPFSILFELQPGPSADLTKDFARMKKLTSEATRAAKRGDIEVEQFETIKAFDEFVEKKSAEIIQEVVDHNNREEIVNAVETRANNYQTTYEKIPEEAQPQKVPSLSEATWQAQMIAAGCIEQMRDSGLLCIDSRFVKGLAGRNQDDYLILRSDRLVFGRNAYRITKKTKVMIAESGGTQVVQSGSTSETSSWGEIRFGNNSDTFSGNSRTSTSNSFSEMDNRSLQLVITDKNWQIDRVFFGNNVMAARAFVQLLQVQIDNL